MKNTNAIAHNNKDENEFNDIVKDHEKLDKADSENK
jgi:hypothetical protein